jgi:hypothetical protein
MSEALPVAPPAAAGASTRLGALGFAAGFLGVLTFHQAMLGVLHWLGLVARAPWAMEPTRPLGVPLVVSASFWGGLWGVVFALTVRRPAGLGRYLLAGVLFGAVLPTLVAWFVVAPLKGAPAAAGWDPSMMMVGPLVNGAWGLGTALVLWLTVHRSRDAAS